MQIEQIADNVKMLRDFHAAHQGWGFDGMIETINALVDLVEQMHTTLISYGVGGEFIESITPITALKERL